MDIFNGNWIRQSFMIPRRALSEADRKRRVRTTANEKFTDTTPGGNFAINNPPQFTRTADRKKKGRFAGSKGMGRYYSEAIDDAQQRIHMRMGVPEYNSLTTFFGNFYDAEQGSLANTGKSKGIAYTLGQVTGYVFALPLVPFAVAGKAYRFFTNKPYSKYYYIKPTMPLYWGAVDTIVNMLAVNLGFTAAASLEKYEVQEDGRIKGVVDREYGADDVAAMNRALPDVFRADGTIDVYAIANRAQRLSNRQMASRVEALKSPISSEQLLKLAEGEAIDAITDTGKITFKEYMDNYHNSKISQDVAPVEEQPEGVFGWARDFFESTTANLQGGMDWVTFNVQADKTVSESFSNQIGESSIGEKINGISASTREGKFSIMGGNLGDGPISGILETVLETAKDFASGVAAGVGASGVAALGGSAFIDIPQHWQAASAELPTQSYTMELRAPYGNKLSIFLNLYLPLAMILAAALPISTGRQSYTSPFLVELYSQGRCQTRTGMIESLSITRGVGNAGWSMDKLPLGIDISFTVKDMSSVMHMPLSNQFSVLDDDSAFTDYMATLGALGLIDQVYPVHKFKRNLSRLYTSFNKYTSPHYYSSQFSSSLTGDALSMWFTFAGRP